VPGSGGETSELLTAEESLRDHGLEFTNHYIMTAACVPSRSSIFTGQYPSLHGNTQTPGAAKTNIEMDMHWLDPNTLPTIGNYFRAGGYDTYYTRRPIPRCTRRWDGICRE
jgi:arylsulfatase A-like enzyme